MDWIVPVLRPSCVLYDDFFLYDQMDDNGLCVGCHCVQRLTANQYACRRLGRHTRCRWWTGSPWYVLLYVTRSSFLILRSASYPIRRRNGSARHRH